MKKGLALALVLGILVLLSGCTQSNNANNQQNAATVHYTSGGWAYILQKDGTACITDWVSTESDLVIPDKIEGKAVTSIGDRAFSSCVSLTSITLPEGVTSIGDEAIYGCFYHKSIIIPDSVTFIGKGDFGHIYEPTLITANNSYAEQYAAYYGIPYSSKNNDSNAWLYN